MSFGPPIIAAVNLANSSSEALVPLVLLLPVLLSAMVRSLSYVSNMYKSKVKSATVIKHLRCWGHCVWLRCRRRHLRWRLLAFITHADTNDLERWPKCCNDCQQCFQVWKLKHSCIVLVQHEQHSSRHWHTRWPQQFTCIDPRFQDLLLSLSETQTLIRNQVWPYRLLPCNQCYFTNSADLFSCSSAIG